MNSRDVRCQISDVRSFFFLISDIRLLISAVVLLALLLLTSCRFSLDELRYMKLDGKDFSTSLAREYRLLAQRKAARAGWWDADYFAEKGLRSARGIAVEPEKLEDWKVPETLKATLQEARRTLLKTVSGLAITLSPEASAHAYALYDCWVMESENKATMILMDSCRQEFFEALNYISITRQAVPEGKVIDYGKVEQEQPASMPAKPSPAPKSLAYRIPVVKAAPHIKAQDFTLLFAPASAALSAEDMQKVEQVALTLTKAAQYEVILNGHADTAEPVVDAMLLSRQRAESVKDALVQKGVDKARIQLYGFGDSDPAKPAAEDEQQPDNRRVQVFIQ